MKKWTALLLTATLLVSLVGCSTNAASQSTQEDATSTSQTSTTSTSGDKYTFTDSIGREVEVPKDITKIAPSGPLAQVVLYTLCPEKLVGLASEVSSEQEVYMGTTYSSLPVFGNFYGDTLNLEAVMNAKPEIVIDIGEAKGTVEEDMAGVQDKTGIPSVFVEMTMDSMADAYRTLGKLVGEEERAKEMADYIEKTLSSTKEKVDTIPENERKTVYYGQSEGLTAVVAGTVHSDVIDYAGGINVATVEESVRGGANDISMEQLLLWNPDVILFAPQSIYADVAQKSEWAELNAIKNNTYYEIPAQPYNWMGRPPSVNRIIGIKWLSNLLYPDVFKDDMVKEAKDFYELFYHYDLTDEQAKELMANSTYKTA